MIYIINKKLSTKYKFIFLLVVLVSYEIFEFLLYTQSQIIFRAETFVDITYDVIFGMTGASIAKFTSKINNNVYK